MNSITAVVSGLQAALLFARGRVDGLRYLSPDQANTVRSFWALPITLPAAVCLPLIGWVQSGIPAQASHALALDLLTFVVGWLAYAVISFHLARLIGAGERWPRFIAAWNWCNVIENLLLVVGCIPGLLGAPTLLNEAAQVFSIGWALWIEWFAIRHSLETNGWVAAWLVVLDVSIGLLLAALAFG